MAQWLRTLGSCRRLWRDSQHPPSGCRCNSVILVSMSSANILGHQPHTRLHSSKICM
ncbi:hypothetical protein LEMLEM_LOCUS24364, partial [Lemmus lemmus]